MRNMSSSTFDPGLSKNIPFITFVNYCCNSLRCMIKERAENCKTCYFMTYLRVDNDGVFIFLGLL